MQPCATIDKSFEKNRNFFLFCPFQVKFWSDMIERWAEKNKRATFSPAELKVAFAGPHCLREVIVAAGFHREEDVRCVRR